MCAWLEERVVKESAFAWVSYQQSPLMKQVKPWVSNSSMVLIRNRATARHLLDAAAVIAPKEEYREFEQAYKSLRREAKTAIRADKRRRDAILAEEIAEHLALIHMGPTRVLHPSSLMTGPDIMVQLESVVVEAVGWRVAPGGRPSGCPSGQPSGGASGPRPAPP